MVRTSTTRRSEKIASRTADAVAGHELPPRKAFVLQLSQDTGPNLQPFGGRLEHLSTGKRLRFDELDQFLEALARLLQEVGPDDGASDD